jgi:DNA-binding protein H-NS
MKERDLMTKSDITQMSEQEIKDYLQRRKEEQEKLVRENGVKAKAELEAYCLKKYNMTLQQIFTASDKAPKPKRQFKNPQDNSTYTYSGKGKLPAWVKPEYEIKAN